MTFLSKDENDGGKNWESFFNTKWTNTSPKIDFWEKIIRKKNQTNVQKKAKILVLTFSVSIQLQNNNLKWNFDLYLSQNNR